MNPRISKLGAVPLAIFLVLSVVFLPKYIDPKAAVRTVAQIGAAAASATRPTETTLLGNIIEAIYKPQLHPITANNFTDETGEVFRITGEPFYKKGLGKRVLILDADTRPMNTDGELLSPAGVKWPHPDSISAARIHGYDYKLIQMTQVSDWSYTWSKIPAIKHALTMHDIVVFLDQDAVFRYPALPLEWLLNHWQHTNATSLMMAADPDKPFNTDQHGNRYLNTGFIVAQNSSRTHRLIDAWMRCPFGEEYDDCKKYAYDWPHEQAALVSFIRQHEFTRPDDILSIPCAEANGSPYTVDEHGCRGALVRHLWRNGKGRQPEELADQVLQYVMPALYGDFREAHYKSVAEASEAKPKQGESQR